MRQDITYTQNYPTCWLPFRDFLLRAEGSVEINWRQSWQSQFNCSPNSKYSSHWQENTKFGCFALSGFFSNALVMNIHPNSHIDADGIQRLFDISESLEPRAVAIQVALMTVLSVSLHIASRTYVYKTWKDSYTCSIQYFTTKEHGIC